MTLYPDYRGRLLSETSRLRRQLGGSSLRAFSQLYLAHHFDKTPSRMHLDIGKLLEDAQINRLARIAVAAPRGHAKTTLVSLTFVLWCVLYRREEFVLLFSATREQAVQLLTDLKKELTSNPLLLLDFPETCRPEGKVKGLRWKDNQIVLSNGACVRGLGSEQRFRGTKHRQFRPSLIICDDLEELEAAQSAEQRQKLRDWFEKTVLNCGDARTNVIVIGTILHYDSLLANITKGHDLPEPTGGWNARLYKAVENFADRQDLWDQWRAIRRGEQEYEGRAGRNAAQNFFEAKKADMLQGAKVLWPELDDYYRLMSLKEDNGRASFQSEKQNEPLDPAECLFAGTEPIFWDDPKSREYFSDVPELLQSIPPAALQIYGACDPSMGNRGRRGDYSAIVTIARNRRTGAMYVIDAQIVRRTPEEMIEAIVMLARTYRYRKFAVEANQFQKLLVDLLKVRCREAGMVPLNLEPITSTVNKKARIEALQPLIAGGTLRLSRKHMLLLEQLRQFPLGDHDDGPDAMEMAATLASRGPRCDRPSSIEI